MKKKTLYGLLGILLPYCGYAAAKLPSSSTGNEYPEHQIAAEIDAMTAQTVHGALGARSASHGGAGLYFAADALLWQAEEDGLEYANRIKIEHLRDSKQELKNVHFDWHFGYRLGLGYLFDKHDQWDTFLQWTHFNSKATGSSGTSSSLQTLTGEPTVLHPEWGDWSGGTFFTDSVSHATATWHLDFNTVDLDLGRNYFLTKFLSWRPSIGVRIATIHQHYKASYDVPFFNKSGALFTTVGSSMSAKNNFNGAGLKGGTEMLWHLTSHWGILGKCAGSLLYGENHVRQKFSSFGFPGTSLVPEPFVIKETTHPLRANLEAALGFQWETMFCKNKGFFSIALYYEIAEWFAQNQLNHPTFLELFGSAGTQPFEVINQRDPGNLSLQGFNLNVRFDY